MNIKKNNKSSLDGAHSMDTPHFTKVTIAPTENQTLTDKDRTLLIRTGNQQFNAGQYEAAGRIFKTTGYRDGLIRVGDHYRSQHAPIDAFRMYRAASSTEKTGELIAIFAHIIQYWLKEKI